MSRVDIYSSGSPGGLKNGITILTGLNTTKSKQEYTPTKTISDLVDQYKNRFYVVNGPEFILESWGGPGTSSILDILDPLNGNPDTWGERDALAYLENEFSFIVQAQISDDFGYRPLDLMMEWVPTDVGQVDLYLNILYGPNNDGTGIETNIQKSITITENDVNLKRQDRFYFTFANQEGMQRGDYITLTLGNNGSPELYLLRVDIIESSTVGNTREWSDVQSI